MKKLFVIQSQSNTPAWGDVMIYPQYRSHTWKESLFPSAYISSTFKEARRLNIFQALYYICILAITHRWLGRLRIKYVPFYWWEKTQSHA